MAGQLPECVIVSTDREADVKPYCLILFREEQGVWQDVFPWEFPQNGTKDQEEEFLGRFFSKTEIHVQGYRFLKSAWYWIAMYNLHYRVPELTKWWLKKPSSIDLINDPDMAPFLLKADAKPSTFFSEEYRWFTEKFLSWSIPDLQQSIKTKIEEREAKENGAKEKPQPDSLEMVVSQEVPHEIKEDPGPPTAQSVDSEGRVVSTTLSLPTPTHVQQPDSAKEPESAHVVVPQSAPPHITTNPTPPFAVSQAAANQQQFHPHDQFLSRAGNREKPVQHAHPLPARVMMSNEYPHQQDYQPQPRKRGNSGSRRFNNRPGGHFQHRHAHTSHERNSPAYPPPGYFPSPVPTPNQPHAPSGGHMEFIPAHMGPTVSPAVHLLPAPFGPPGSMQQQNIPPDARGFPEHFQQYFGIMPFGDRSNNQYPDRNFAGQPQVTYIPDSLRGGYRHDSIGDTFGTRGGRHRGNMINRGKNVRGRNSLSSQDRPPFMRQGDNFTPETFGDFKTHPSKHRRGSFIHEPNWRSGSDNPQTQQADRVMKENVVPHQHQVDQNEQPLSTMPRHQILKDAGPPAQPEFEQRLATNQTHMYDQPRPSKRARRDPEPFSIDPRTLTHQQTCNRDWIGKDCTLVTKLLVFDVPLEASDEMVKEFFERFGKVESASRSISWQPDGQMSKFAHDMVWVQFEDSTGARNCFANKPKRWINDKVLRVEVPRQFWDPNHHKYVFADPGSYTRPPEDPKAANQVHTILRRREESVPTTRAASLEQPVIQEAQSSETTPTPSGASTPKKSKKGGKKKNKNLRKVSLNPAGDQKEASTEVSDHRGGDPAASANGGGPGIQAAAPTEDHDSSLWDITAAQKERSASVQTEVQTLSEPPLSPDGTEEIKTPAPTRLSHQDSNETLKPVSVETEVQTTSELGISPTDEIRTNLPDPTQPFREEKETTPQETETAGLDAMAESKIADVTESSAKVDVTPPKRSQDPSDDSFHTASASPPEEKYDGGDEASMISDSETVTADTDKVVDPPIEEAPNEEGKWPSDVVLPSSPSSGVSPTTVKKVHIPHLPAKSRIVSEPYGSGNKSLTVESSHHATSAVSPALPTPAFVTAPNTPAVTKDSPKEDAKAEGKETNATPEPPKQAEKTKGPAQTESFSLFGKKKEKKPKGGKKGTVKGKPKADGASGSASRVTSGAVTPNPEQTTQDTPTPSNNKRGGEGKRRAESKQSDASSKAPTTAQDTEKDIAEDLVGRLSAQQDTPSKRKGVRGLLSLITGGQTSFFQSKSDQPPPTSRDPLTGTKAQDHPPETETKAASDNVDEAAEADETTEAAEGGEGGEGVVETHEPDAGGEDPMPEVGLGISTVGGEQSQEFTGSVRSKSKKKKKKSKKKGPAESSSDAQPSSTPASEQKTVSGRLGFGEDSFSGFGFEGSKIETNEGSRSPFPAPVHDDAGGVDDVDASAVASDVSPRTVIVREDVRLRDVSSPTPSTPTKRMPTKPSGSSHLVEAKTPKWRQKKREKQRKVETPPESEGEEEEQEEEQEEEEESPEEAIWVIQEVESRSESSLTPGRTGKEKLFLYVGKGRSDQDGDVSGEELEAEQPRETVQTLAREEQRRRQEAGPPPEADPDD